MSCYSCARQYSFFVKEYGCKNCGFSFCSKCLNNTAVVPKCGAKAVNVCSQCFQKLTQPINQSVTIIPPKNLIEREARLAVAKSDKSQSVSRNVQVPQHTLNVKDIEDRLAVLRGQDVSVARQRAEEARVQVIQPVLWRSSEEQARQLLNEAVAESAIEQKFDSGKNKKDPVIDISERLARLRGQDRYTDPREWVNAGHQQQETLCDGSTDEHLLKLVQLEAEKEALRAITELSKDKEIQVRLQKLRGSEERGTLKLVDEDSEEEDDEARCVERLIKQMQEEELLDQRLGLPALTTKSTLKEGTTQSALPTFDEAEMWCCICLKDAQLYCSGCDNDLYCRRCFKEGHDLHDLDHKAVAVKL